MRYTLDSKSQKTRIRQLKNSNPQTPEANLTKDLEKKTFLQEKKIHKWPVGTEKMPNVVSH